MEKALPISLKLNITPNTLGRYELSPVRLDALCASFRGLETNE